MTTRHQEPIFTMVILSIVICMALAIVPLPNWANTFRPDWVPLIMIYWLLVHPHRVGIGAAWLSGLVLDALKWALLGQHALAMALVGFLTLRFRLRIRVFPVWQQMTSIALIIAVYQFTLYWIDGVQGETVPLIDRVGAVVASALAWPFITVFLSGFRHGRSA